jgi:sarcosine oxidase subunit alpha
VVKRISEDRFVFSASSSHVDGVRFRLEDARQDRFGRGRVFVHDVTQGFVTLTATCLKARDPRIAAGLPLQDLPHMGVAETTLDGAPLHIARVSLTGDASYELSISVRQAQPLRARVDRALVPLGGRWIGLEAVMIPRAERGIS